MVKTVLSYRCVNCNSAHKKWAGRCDSCGEWNSIKEEAPLATGPKGKTLGANKGRKIILGDLSTIDAPLKRSSIGINEFDRVLGGGLVPASAILVSGDPGIGKSTLLLQAAADFARTSKKVIYISGEEASSQIRMRAQRLDLTDASVLLATETNLRDILTTFAKRKGIAIMLVGHVTKDGQIAGPRVVEHMVDTVLHFEGERGHQFRILRAVKNRFGASDEIGVFEMTGRGLEQVINPSELFLSERDTKTTGSVVFAGIEGTRPLLVEIQALVAPSPLATPRRTVVGWDNARLSMVLAVLEARCGISFAGKDVYLNIAGGLRISEPAADLAVAAALISSRQDIPIAPDTVVFGEISLSGIDVFVENHFGSIDEE